MSEAHPIDTLFEALASIEKYPPGVAPTSARIPRLAFFPGGAGLWGVQPGRPLPVMPVGGVMVLGHNFDSVAGYERSLAQGTEDERSPTWRSLLTLLRACDIAPDRCFFTNAYMGLKADTGKATGAFPGARDPDFVARCRTFLRAQIQAQQPRLVMTLGIAAPRMLAPLAPELERAWRGASGLQALDRREAALVYPVHFSGVERSAAVVALTHPSLRAPNVWRRSYQGLAGNDAESRLVQDGLRLSRDDSVSEEE